MTEELKPCPFCGSENWWTHEVWNRHTDHAQGYYVECYDCGAMKGAMMYENGTWDGYYKTREEAIEDWNTRAELGRGECELVEHGSLANWPDMVCWSCSECEFGWHHSRNDKQFSYCPNCGAKVNVQAPRVHRAREGQGAPLGVLLRRAAQALHVQGAVQHQQAGVPGAPRVETEVQMICPLRFGKQAHEGGEECVPDCAWLVKDVAFQRGDGPWIERRVCGLIAPERYAVNGIEREVD